MLSVLPYGEINVIIIIMSNYFDHLLLFLECDGGWRQNEAGVSGLCCVDSDGCVSCVLRVAAKFVPVEGKQVRVIARSYLFVYSPLWFSVCSIVHNFVQGFNRSWKVLQSPEKWRKKNQALKSPEIGHWSWKSPEKVLIFDHNGAEKSIRPAAQHVTCAAVLEVLHSCWSSLMLNRAIVIVVAMNKQVLHWHCIFTLPVSCFAIKFIGWGPKRYKNRCWFFVSQVLKSPELLSWDLNGNPVIVVVAIRRWGMITILLPLLLLLLLLLVRTGGFVGTKLCCPLFLADSN